MQWLAQSGFSPTTLPFKKVLDPGGPTSPIDDRAPHLTVFTRLSLSNVIARSGLPLVARRQAAVASGGHDLPANKDARIQGTPATDRRRPVSFPVPGAPTAAPPSRAPGCRCGSG